MAKDPNDLFEIHGIDVNAEDPNDLFQKQAITSQEEQNRPYQIRMNQERQNTIPGGFITHIANLPSQYINPLLLKARELAESSNSHLFLNRNKPVTQIPEFAEPENPSTEYNIGHALGYVPEVFMYGPTAYKAIKYGLKGIGKGINAINPRKTLNELKAAYSEEAVNPIIEQGTERYNESINPFGKESFNKKSAYLNEATPENIEDYSMAVRKFNKRLLKNMDIENAHNLRKQMNSERYQNLYPRRESISGLDTEGGNRLEAYETLGDLLKKDIYSSLKAQSPKAASEYLESDVNWAKNVHPRIITSKLLKGIAHKPDFLGRRTAEKIIERSIKNPEDVMPETLDQAYEILKKNKNLKLTGLAAGVISSPYSVPYLIKHLLHGK